MHGHAIDLGVTTIDNLIDQSLVQQMSLSSTSIQVHSHPDGSGSTSCGSSPASTSSANQFLIHPAV